MLPQLGWLEREAVDLEVGSSSPAYCALKPRASIGAGANGETVGADARRTGEQGGERRRAWRGDSKQLDVLGTSQRGIEAPALVVALLGMQCLACHMACMKNSAAGN
jgi:hypothetical protein